MLHVVTSGESRSMNMSQIVKKLTAWILLISQLAFVPTVPLISQQDHIDLAAHYSTLAKETAQAVLTLSGIKNASVTASATMEFDKEKLEKDAKVWYDTQISTAAAKSEEMIAASQTNFTKLLQLAQEEQKKRVTIFCLAFNSRKCSEASAKLVYLLVNVFICDGNIIDFNRNL